MLKSIHHVAIICSDYQRSKHFYVQILGLRIIREVYRTQRQSYKLDLALLPTADSPMLELFSFPAAPARPSYPEAQGLRHLAFAVDHLDDAMARLQGHGIALEAVRIDEHTGKRFTFFADPDGLPLELYEL